MAVVSLGCVKEREKKKRYMRGKRGSGKSRGLG
jgi:hypothetical protein